MQQQQILTLLFRPYCSLCTEMLRQLELLQTELSFVVEVIDVDENEDLIEKYNELVPVLLAGEQEICHWYLDEEALRAYFH